MYRMKSRRYSKRKYSKRRNSKQTMRRRNLRKKTIRRKKGKSRRTRKGGFLGMFKNKKKDDYCKKKEEIEKKIAKLNRELQQSNMMCAPVTKSDVFGDNDDDDDDEDEKTINRNTSRLQFEGIEANMPKSVFDIRCKTKVLQAKKALKDAKKKHGCKKSFFPSIFKSKSTKGITPIYEGDKPKGVGCEHSDVKMAKKTLNHVKQQYKCDK